MSFIDIARVPDAVTVHTDAGRLTLTDATNAGFWGADDVTVGTQTQDDTLKVTLAAQQSAVQRVHLRWRGSLPLELSILGDHWERGYGDLEWRGHVPERIMPWYFLTHDGSLTHAYGVKTGAGSLCFWQADPDGVSLWLDVRCGSQGVRLGGRTLDAATVICRQGPGVDPNSSPLSKGAGVESPFAAATSFCRLLCDNPRMPAAPVYGGNNWYYAYGNSSAEEIVKDAGIIADLAPSGWNRPFMVIDDGWQLNGPTCGGGPWRYGNSKFPDMGGLAARMSSMGVRPGIWVRPLLTRERLPGHWFLPAGRCESGSDILDPSIPEVLELVRSEIRCQREWGYELIKHDFTTYDLLGLWGFAMGSRVTGSNWCFSDLSRTNAEIITGLYRTIREAAGDALVMGCNTIGHLGAGLFDLQRTGDDTSGRDWERTRKMGVNTLAFRMPQHGAFFAVDADCVGVTNDVPWDKNAQWLDLLARSGTPLFASIDPKALGAPQRTALKEAFALAAVERPVAEPIDWMHTTCPSIWRIDGEERRYDWSSQDGASPFMT